MSHNDILCPKYHDLVLPDEIGNCSLCGAILTPTPNHQATNQELYKLLIELHPDIGIYSYDYYKDTNRTNNAGVCTLKGLFLSMFTLEELTILSIA